MTNEQRRLALAKARLKALEHAEAAEKSNFDNPFAIEMANMWSGVAQAMKIGPNIQADGSGPEPPDEPFVNRPAFETR